jgi:hypothetical protein
MRVGQSFRAGLLGSIVVAGILGLSFVHHAFATPGVLPLQTVLTTQTSSRDANATLQTIYYRFAATKPGKIISVKMTLPVGATVSSPRSASGTVTQATAGQIIWRPNAPITVLAGTKLAIPVAGINYHQAGTTSMWLTAKDATGEILAYARDLFVITSQSIGCQPTGNGYIQAENAKPGTPKEQWDIAPANFAPTTFSGYLMADSYKCGDLAYLKIDSQLTNFATAKVYRMGYYGGAGAREIWSTTDFFLSGKQPAAKIVNTTSPAVRNMVDASGWRKSIAIRIDGRFTPGTYLTKITDRGGREAYVPFTVRDDSAVKHAYMLQQATTTWQAYNQYGGNSFYRPAGAQSSHLNFNRPYAEALGKGSGQYLQLEYGLVWWMEKNGYDVSYWTDTDLHSKPTQLATRTRNLILPAHDEYYSYAMRNTVVNGIGTKVNLVSLGANQMYRPIIFSSANRVFEVEGKIPGKFTSTLFRTRGQAYAEQNVFGAQYGCGSNGSIRPNNSWIWNGVPAGTVLEGLANGETDHLYPNFPNPVGNTILTSAPLTSCSSTTELKRMDIVSRTTPAGTRVFAGSSFAYSCFLNNSCNPGWSGRGTGFSVDAADSAAVGVMLTNALRWSDTGQTVEQAPL